MVADEYLKDLNGPADLFHQSILIPKQLLILLSHHKCILDRVTHREHCKTIRLLTMMRSRLFDVLDRDLYIPIGRDDIAFLDLSDERLAPDDPCKSVHLL